MCRFAEDELENALYIKCVSEDMESRWVTNRTERFENCSCNPRIRSPMLPDQILDCKWCNTYYVGETRKALQSRKRKNHGASLRRETTSLILMHTTETGHSFGFENAKAVNHGRSKGERLVNEALHSGPQAINRCVSLPIQ